MTDKIRHSGNLQKNMGRVLTLAAELVRTPAIQRTFKTADLLKEDGPVVIAREVKFSGKEDVARLMSSLPGLSHSMSSTKPCSDAAWAAQFSVAFETHGFQDIVQHSTETAWPIFRKVNIAEVVSGMAQKPAVEDRPMLEAVSRVHPVMAADGDNERWAALVVFSVARLIAETAHSEFQSEKWTELSYLSFALEKSFLVADGATAASLIVELDTKFMSGELSNHIARQMLKALVEAAMAKPESAFFNID